MTSEHSAWYAESMKMTIHSVTRQCAYGCCGSPPKQKYLGTHADETKKRVLRSLKKKDRQRGYREIQSQQD